VITADKEKYSWETPTAVSLFFTLLCLPGLITPIHGDEAVTYLEHIVSTPFQLLFQYSGPNQHTLFSILSNSLMRIIGEYEIIFRLPVFAAAILSIFVIYHLGQSFGNRTVATIASFLIIGSYHHFYWAQFGRGYALTELLALTSVLGITLLLDKKPNEGALVLVFSGFTLCLALPSNAYFLPGCGIATLVVLWRLKKTEGPVFWFLLSKKLLPSFLFLMVLTAGYFFMIYDDLVRGIETHKNFLNQAEFGGSTAVTLSQFHEIIRGLARPWGLWFYIPVLYGLWTLNKTRRVFFLILFGTPALVTVLSGMMGPPRAYIYMFPFLILLAALGIDRGIGFLSRFASHYFKKILLAILCLVFLIPSVLNHFQNYRDTTKVKYATMNESREVLRHLQKQVSQNELLVIPIDDMALRRNLESLVAKKMLRVFKDGRLDGITFIGHKDVQELYLYPHDAIYPGALPDSSVQVIADIGNVRIHRMNGKITPLFPLEADINFSRRWGKFRNPKLSKTNTRKHKFLGQQSLQIKKNMQEDALVYSPSTKHISSQDISFILYGYAGKYQQKSKAGLLVKGDQQAFPLNHLFGVYQENKDDLAWKSIHPFFFFRHLKHEEHFKWQIIFMLLPLNAGLTEIQESLFLREEISYFDGFQGYLLTPIVEGN